LVVDDDPVNRDLMGAVLDDLGLSWVAVADGPSCLRRCQEDDIGVVLLDVMMPAMDGFEVCRAVKANPVTSLLPVIMVTALNDRAARIRGMEAGADDFLTKPIDVAELGPRVRSALRTHRLVAETQSVYTLAAALCNALEARETYTHDHATRVAWYSIALGDQLGVDAPAARREVYLGALLHDIGKVGIPDAILRKPGPLTVSEREIIETHPGIGARICAANPGLSRVANIVLSHHERWDGMGYPRGLRGLDIPFAACIIAVGDAFDAMTSDRPYHRAISAEEARREIARCRAEQFHPDVVDAFLAISPGTLGSPPPPSLLCELWLA
jgi:putative two-component system response regulator